jgi:hypothetical protein
LRSDSQVRAAAAAEGDAMKQLASLADSAVTKGRVSGACPTPRCRGLVEYRQENYGAAESWLRQALSTPNVGWPVKVPAELVLAMAQQQRGQRNEARESLRRAVAQLEKDLPQPGSPAVGTSWPDWLVCQVLRREAETLIEGNKPFRNRSWPPENQTHERTEHH